MLLKEYEIVMEPLEIIFEQIQANVAFTRTLNIRNVGNKGKRMELFRPANKVFNLKCKQPELPVPPGMGIIAVVEFKSACAQEYVDKMVVSIDNKEIEIPIHAYPAQPFLVFKYMIDFGTLSANNKTVTRPLKITNHGAIDGQFLIDYKGSLPVSFSPSQGVVPAYSALTLNVDLFTKTPGNFEEKIMVELPLEETKTKSLILKANLMKQELILLDSKNSAHSIKKLDFGSCYYGCNLLSVAILYNSSPDSVDYVIVLEENGVGTEIGAELSKSTTALKAKDNEYDEKDFAPLDKLVSAFPNNGTLQPFEKRPIFIRFSPQYKNPDSGFSTVLKPPPRRDYALFLYFELLGGFGNGEETNRGRTELAITGTALPVLLRLVPNRLTFGKCVIGEKKEAEVVVYNDSELKDVRFKFCKVANFTVQPACGRIKPRSSKCVTVSFVPHQMGSFSYELFCEVTDKMAEADNPLVSLDKMICKYPIHLTGEAVLVANFPEAKYSGGDLPKQFCAGTMPLITNEVGINVNTSMANLRSFLPKAAVQNAPKDSLHFMGNADKIKNSAEAEKYRVAFPNDRSRSIGPFDRREKYKTIFTGFDRYNYIDPDYAYTDEEMSSIENHKLVYKKYLDDLQFYRREKSRNQEFHAFKSETNAGLKPGGGLKPQMPSLKDLHQEATKPPSFNVDPNWKLLTTEELLSQQKSLKPLKSSSSINSLSVTDRNKLSTILTPAQIYKIIVSPSVLDFGEVCVNSASSKVLEFYNTLDQPINVELEIDSSELSQTSVRSQIIPGQSKASFELLFESAYVQSFQRSISYRINFSYQHHLIVQAECKLPSLRLNTAHLVLNQIHDVEPEMCYRSNITVLNRFNSFAEFNWMPIYGEQGTAFSIRPATGTIEPNQDLECEVVWHGSYLAPLKGTFALQVTGGESTTLTCEAKLGHAQLQFINRRANFGKIPVNTTSVKTFYLTNNGTHNAYFQVLDPRPMPGMAIKPAYGLAALNGLTPLSVEFTPREVLKFDVRVLIQVRGGKQLELRMSGESEDPSIDVDLPSFDFGGVNSGAVSSLPFKITNKSQVNGKIEFNLKRYPDFFIKAKDKSTQLAINDRMYELEIDANKTVDMDFYFAPSEVASYDFDLPIFVNRIQPETAAEMANSQADEDELIIFENNENKTLLSATTTPFGVGGDRQRNTMSTTMTRSSPPSMLTTPYHQSQPTTAASSSSQRRRTINQVLTRKVTAVGLRHALHLSTSLISFRIPIKYFENLKEGGFYEAKSTLLINQSHRPVKWCFDLRRSNKVLEDGIFKLCDGSMIPFVSTDKQSYGPEGEIQPNESYELKILFCPDKPGTYRCNLPIVVNNNFEHPYYKIEVFGELLLPEIQFEPDMLIFKPVPLGVEISDQLLIRPKGYESKSKLRLEIPESKTIDGDSIQVLEASFENGELIINPPDESPLLVNIKFRSPKPISSQSKLKFIDDHNREYIFTVVFTADNSLFTCHSFIAEHQNVDYRIVLERGQVMKGSSICLASDQSGEGEPLLRPMTGASGGAGNSYAATSMYDDRDSSSAPSPSPSLPPHQQQQQQIVIDGNNSRAMTTSSTYNNNNSNNIMVVSKSLEQILLPPADSVSGFFALELVRVLQRWFRCHGWPTSYNLVSIPESFRSAVSRKPLGEGMDSMPQQDASKRENKTIYDMIAHLCGGRSLPAIPVGSPTPVDLVERTVQFVWQHNVLLKFIEIEGGCVSHIRPEHLLDLNEYKCWFELVSRRQKDTEESSGYKKNEVEQLDSPSVPLRLFNIVSKKAWLDCLLQLLKICVLNRITPKLFKSMSVPFNREASFPDVKTDPLTSNIYSTGERILLAWLNYCYANYKSKIWPGAREPPARWIVNFDVDLADSLVLASALAAYCPFVVDGLISRMHTVPQVDTAEKCFHNALIFVDACRRLGLDYDVTSLDITDPNPIAMCLFCAYMFTKLPCYAPTATVEFKSQLHLSSTKQIKISNPSTKSIFYQAILCGKGTDDFSLPNGSELLIQSKGKFNLSVQFKGNNLKPKKCFLLLVGRKRNSMSPDTLVFKLNAKIDELISKKLYKFQTALYQQTESSIDVESPYDKAGEFKVAIIESGLLNGIVRNPFNEENEAESKSSIAMSKNKSKSTSMSYETGFKSITQSFLANAKSKKNTTENDDRKEDIDPTTPIYKSFHTKTQSIYLEPKVKKQIVVNYLPLQYVKHAGLILFSNENLGEFIYHLEGNALPPEPTRTYIDEKSLDSDRVKLIKSHRSDIKSVMLRCFVGDRIDIKLLVPVLNQEREKAIVAATEMRMNEAELNRRRIHGVLSSKSLLDSLNSLTLNKSIVDKKSFSQQPIQFKISSSNNQFLSLPETLTINSSDLKSDENFIPLTVRFNAEKLGTSHMTIELASLPNDLRILGVDFKVTESGRMDANATTARLQFNSCVFERIVQPIPIKNPSDMICNYEVAFRNTKDDDKSVFKGLNKFSVRPKDIYNYELTFVPNAEEKFEDEITFTNLTEGTKVKYLLVGVGERKAPLGEIKFETRVGQITQHEITIPNKTNRKVCYHVSSTEEFIKGAEKIMVLPNKKETYLFEIHPIRRGEFKGVITFRPGEWPIKDIDSDGEEMSLDSSDRPQHFTLWYTFDIKILPPPPLSTVELEGNVLDTTTLCIPLSNPLSKKLKFEVAKQGQCAANLEGADAIEIGPNEMFNYELKFRPHQVGKSRASLIFFNNECGEFWYDLKLTSDDALPIQTDLIEAEVGRYAVKSLRVTNPLNEPVHFRTLISNPSHFGIERRRQDDSVYVEPNQSVDVNVVFTPSTLGFGGNDKAAHSCVVTFASDRVGNISYELHGFGLAPRAQEPITVTAEIGHSQMAVVNFRNTTDAALFADVRLLDDEETNVIESVENAFNILLNNLEDIRIEAKSALDIPIVFTPTEMKKFNLNLIVTARRDSHLNWNDNDIEMIDKLTWVYPIKAFTVINAASSKSAAFVIECMVRKRLEKRMEVVLNKPTTTTTAATMTSNATRVFHHTVTGRRDRSATAIRMRPATPHNDDDEDDNVQVEESISGEFVHSIQFANSSSSAPSAELAELVKNSLAFKLVRIERDKNATTLIYDVIFCPPRSFICDAYLQIETTALGGTWRFPLKLVAIEHPHDDTILIDAYRLNKQSIVGFRLNSKTDKPLPFRAQFAPAESAFSVMPSQGELLTEADNGTLIKVGFTPSCYGKTYQSQLIITTPTYQWKYLVKGVTPEYTAPRVQSAIRRSLKLDPSSSLSSSKQPHGLRKRNFVMENTYIIQTAVSSPIKGASLMPLRYANQS